MASHRAASVFIFDAMDPVSATASVMTLISACTSIGGLKVSLIRTLRKAPKELIMLSNEVNDLSAILHEIQLASQADFSNGRTELELQQTSLAQNTTFAAQMIVAKEQIIELDAFVKTLTKSLHGGGQLDVDRLGWVRKKKDARKIQEQLAETRKKLHILMNTHTA